MSRYRVATSRVSRLHSISINDLLGHQIKIGSKQDITTSSTLYPLMGIRRYRTIIIGDFILGRPHIMMMTLNHHYIWLWQGNQTNSILAHMTCEHSGFLCLGYTCGHFLTAELFRSIECSVRFYRLARGKQSSAACYLSPLRVPLTCKGWQLF